MFTKNFKNLSKSDVGIAGGKGASLGEMTQAGIPVPPGFVVLSDSFEKFIDEQEIAADIDAILGKVNHQDTASVERASEEIKAIILDTEMPKDIAAEIKKEFKKLGAKWVAVRSSATSEDSSTAAWAGQLDSFLNTPEDKVLENVRRCWASLFTPRAIFYRFEKGLNQTKISVAVVVQKMVQSEISGIAFSVHPVTQDRNQLIIEASYGLGEAIVSGQVTPDSYVVEKQPRSIIERTIQNKNRGLYRSAKGDNEWRDTPRTKAEQQALSDKQILELSELILHIEKHYGFPCDIEWAFEGGKFYIVQSRPITTLTDSGSTPGGKGESQKDPLILLGAWNVLPLEAWRWFDTASIDRLEKLTGVRIRVFTYVEDELHYECVFERETNELKELFEKGKTEKQQIAYITKIYDDFYKEIVKLEKYIAVAGKKKPGDLSDKQLIDSIQTFADLWTAITMQIWYAVFLDIWYPLPEEHAAAKKIAAEARDRTGHIHERSNALERPLYAEAARRLKLTAKEIDYLFPAEIIDALKNHTSLKKEIAERMKFCVTASVEGEYKIYSGAKARELFEQYQPPSVGMEAKDELSGVTACKGKIKGIVRVIRRDKDFEAFKEGEILVALQTMVHYVPIMKKAAAILTEFGGLTSHAAIVSRELNKPCIVGIPSLLASVKDGDMVEVDADRGIVRILNANSDTVKNLIEKYNIHPPFIQKALPGYLYTIDFVQLLWNAWGDYSGDYYKAYIFSLHDDYLDVYYLPEGLADLRNSYLAKVKADHGYLEKHYSDWKKSCVRLEKEMQQFEKTVETKPFPKFLAAYQSFVKEYLFEYSLSVPIQEACGFQPEQWINPLIEAYCQDNNLEYQKTSALLTSPIVLSFIAQEEIDLYKLALLKKSSTGYTKALNLHQKKWFWIKNNYAHMDPLPTSFFEKELEPLEKLSKEKLKGEITRREGLAKAIEKEKQALIKKHKPSAELSLYLEINELFGEMQDARKALLLQANYYHKLFLEEVSRKFSRPIRDLWFYSYNEMMDAVQNGKFLSQEVIDRRKEMTVALESKDEKIILGGDEARQFFDILNEKSKESAEVKGLVAYPGKVTGKVRIVLRVNEIGKVEKGDILVSSMTRPEMTEAMRKAAAFVTDEGGITCHAAIISREMKKPCIIGTKNATKILKDGDLVEVDADRGIVRLLQSSDTKGVIDDFFKTLGDDKAFYSRGAWSPLIMMLPWTIPGEGFSPRPITLLSINKGRNTLISVSGDQYEGHARDVFSEYLNGKISLKTLQAAFKKSCDATDALYKKVETGVENLDDAALTALIRDAAHEVTRLIAYTLYIETFDREIAFSIANKEQKATLEAIWDKALHPVFESFEIRRLKFIVDLLSKDKNLDRVAKKTTYIYTDYFFPKELDEIKTELATLRKNIGTHKKQIKKYAKELAKKRSDHAAWFKSLSAKQKHVAGYIQFVMETRDVRKDPLAKDQAIIARAAVELLRRAGMPAEYAPVIYPYELANGTDWLRAHREEIAARLQGNALVTYPDGQISFKAGDFDAAISYFENLTAKDRSDTKELRGQSACPGVLKGIVRIVFDPSDVKEFNKGDILVTSMTRPEFVPLMKKAGAVVTNEGGITCHAAIVSRELGIPCVIGTKIATQVLREGEMVEVDADAGIVRKIGDSAAPIINPAEWEYEFQQRNAQPVLMTDFWTRAIVQELPKELHLPDIHIDYLFTNYAKGYVPKKDKADVLKKMSLALEKDAYIRYVAETTMKNTRAFGAIAKRVARQSKGKTADRALLSRLWSEVDRGLVELIAWFWIPWYVTEENYLSNKVNERLAEHITAVEKLTDANNALMTLIFPTKLSLFQEEQASFAKLLDVAARTKNFARDAKFKKAAQKYLDQFSWTGTYFLLPLEKLTFDALVERIQGDLKGNALEEYRLRKIAQEKSMALAKKLTKILHGDAALIKYAAWSREYGWVLSRSIEESLVACATLIDFFKQIASAIGVPYAQWVWFTSEEIKKILDGKLKAADVDIKSREQAHFVLIRSGKIQFFTGERAQELSDFVANNVGKVNKAVTTFKGQPTYPGKAVGRVVIANNGHEAQRLKAGEILVTPMTTPDFVPMMKIAGATITNEGGLLSHAAIISRELHKPCIVGTKIATQVLKDGDMIEVDADTGIVTIIK